MLGPQRLRRIAAFGCAVCLLALAGAGRSPGQATPSGDAPKPPAGPIKDAWLAEAALEQLKQAARDGTYEPLGKSLRAACLARVCCGHLEDLKAINDVWYAAKACQYLPLAARQPKGQELVRRLLEDRELSRLLFRALDEVRAPDKCLEKLQALIDADAKAVEQFPNLAVAFATTREMQHYREQPEAASLEDSFKWYAANKAVPFAYDVKEMPYELARHLADTRLSLKERQWALQTYRGRLNPGKAYFDVKYDTEHYERGVAKKIDPLPYTLMNLKQVGGVCVDQAYYAAEVCKAFGMPAIIVTGAGSSGIGHAWLGCLKIDRRQNQAAWDCQTGRYEAHKYYTGTVRDPIDRSEMKDAELMLSGAAALLPLQRREEADAAADLAEMVSKVDDPQADADRSALQALAETYNQQIRKADRPPVDLDRQMPTQRKPDIALVEDLLAQAITRNLAYRPAWELLVELRRGDKLPVEHLDRFFDLLVSRTAKDYPDYSCELVLQIVPTIKDAAKRIASYERTLQVYGQRPDLQGRILIAVGDDLLAQDDKAKALAAFEQAATRSAEVASVVLVAAERAEKMLLEANRRDLAIVMYEKLFRLSQRSRSDSSFRQQTAYYRLGQRLASLLADAGRGADAEALRRRLDS